MKKWMMIIMAAMMVTACSPKKTETAQIQTETALETEEEAKEEAVSETEQEKTEDSSYGAEEEKKISGTVIDAAMNSIIIKTDDGQELAFSKEDAETELKDGLTIDMKVTLIYTGEIKGTDTSGATVIKITDGE